MLMCDRVGQEPFEEASVPRKRRRGGRHSRSEKLGMTRFVRDTVYVIVKKVVRRIFFCSFFQLVEGTFDDGSGVVR